MSTTLSQITKTRTIGKTVYTAKAELVDLGQGPYFAMTLDVKEQRRNGRWIDVGGGTNHETIVHLFPELEQYIKWHLCHLDRGPWYYFADTLYWAGFKGWTDGKPESPPKWDYAKSTCVFGAAANETAMPDSEEALTLWLKARHPALMDALHAAMFTLFGPEYTAIKAGIKPVEPA